MARQDVSEFQFKEQLRILEKRALSARDPAAEAQFLNMAGDLCVRNSRKPQALKYYGDSVNTYLKLQRYEAAIAVCRKLVRASPEVVRAHCTLAWMTIALGWLGDAMEHIDRYVTAAFRSGREELAVQQLRRMADSNPDPRLRAFIGEELLVLGDAKTADHLLGTVFRSRNGLPSTLPPDAWPLQNVVRMVIQGPRSSPRN